MVSEEPAKKNGPREKVPHLVDERESPVEENLAGVELELETESVNAAVATSAIKRYWSCSRHYVDELLIVDDLVRTEIL